MRVPALVALLIVLAGADILIHQDPDVSQLRIAVDVDLVVFNVTVTDGRGRHVPGLKADDFAVSEDRHPQAITLFSPDDVPASVGLVLDNSGSMLDKRAEVARAAVEFIRASHPGDELFVVNFNEKAALGLPPAIPFTNDVDRLRASILTAPAGLTALYDALAVGIAHLNTGSRDRKALVVLSDGGDNASGRRLEEVLQIARRSSATIHTIGMYDDTNQDRNPRALRQLAQLSGGRAYFPRSLDDLGPVWRDIAGGIRSLYTIGYHSSNPARDGLFRKVTITTRRGARNLRVTTREGYLAPAGDPIDK